MNVVYIYIYKSKYVYTRYVFRRLDLSSGWEEWEEWEEWDRQEQSQNLNNPKPRLSMLSRLAIGPLSFVRTSLAVSSGSMVALMYMRALPPGREELLGR